jgi:hypothetical protein
VAIGPGRTGRELDRLLETAFVVGPLLAQRATAAPSCVDKEGNLSDGPRSAREPCEKQNR